MRRTPIAVLVLALFASILAIAPAQAAEGDDVEDVRLSRYLNVRTSRTAAVTKGDTAWVTVSLRGKRDVTDLQVTAVIDQAGAAVSYPANTETFSSTYADADLDRRETDYIAFQVTIPTEVTGRGRNVDLEMEFTFTDDGDRLRGEETVTIPVVDFDGSPFALTDDDIALPAAANGWVELPFAGLAPEVSDFRIVVEDPPGLDIHYPAETHTSLARDALLEDGETDVARFRLGEAHWAAPSDATIRVDYVLAGEAATERFDITITPG